ncbi:MULTISPECIES: subclass B1 metallo-beta-lactamase [unclassified Saccharicrinis]|uniref:subclass B1 metallo-beta-lactamase n=1 Tax=unclassified Saccharicrinis TaxID=2646859 RepID=UPI003D342A9D
MKRYLQFNLALLVTLQLCTSILAQQTPEQIVREYFEAFSNSNYASLNEYITDDFVMREGDFEICSNRHQFYTVFQWDSVFVPKYEVRSIKTDGEIIKAVIAKSDKRVDFLHDEPMVSNVQIKLTDDKIKLLDVTGYAKFDAAKWRGRLNNVNSWVGKHQPDLNGFARDITPHGSKNYMKAIQLYSNRKLEKEEKIFIDKDLQLVHLKDSVFVHITKYRFNGGKPFPSNGLIVAKQGKAIMVDTPVTMEQTERLFNYLKDKMNINVTQLIPGHFHIDCMGGIKYMHSQGVNSLANKLTVDKCLSSGLTVPKESFENSRELNFNGLPVECRFFGGGHSFDNITVWLPDSKILFGGCMVKNIKAQGMGNLSDAVVKDWDSTVEKVQKAYPDAEIVIPGHGNYGGQELLSHTYELVKNYKLKYGIK